MPPATPSQPTPQRTDATDQTDGAPPVAGEVNAFGVDLLQQLDSGGNVVISPLSVAVALSMMANGADDEARAELDRALHAGANEARRNAELGQLVSDLLAGSDVDVRIAQSLWAQVGFAFRPEYIDRVLATFDATLAEVDLGSQESADQIDAWVSKHTKGLIETIAADMGLPDPMMVLVLLNATYFHGKWSTPFDPKDTRTRTFHRTSEGAVETDFLIRDETRFGYDDTPTRQLLRMPYGDNRHFVMDVYLPQAGHRVSDVLDELSTDPNPRERELAHVAIPKLELRWQGELKPALQALGVQRVWDEGALGRLSPSPHTHLSTVVHKTYVEVDEEGTRAAAVTGAGIQMTSAPAVPPPSFIANRPFAFAIRDIHTGVVMFAGIVTDPTATS